MRRSLGLLTVGLLVFSMAFGREDPGYCGTYRERLQEDMQLHRRNVEMRRSTVLRPRSTGGAQTGGERSPVSTGRVYGDLAVFDDSDGIVARLNEFNLNNRTLAFTPADAAASRYRYSLGAAQYDIQASKIGLIQGFGDDDTRLAPLPFSFPFFGETYTEVFINSDGNLTFRAPDVSTSERSLGRMTAGPPRIAPFFRDLDPSVSSNGVYVAPGSDRFIVTWVAVPEYRDAGTGPVQTFQVRLYPDGRIEFTYAGGQSKTAVVGIAPGNLQGSSAVVRFLDPSGQEYSSAIAERFSEGLALDLVMAAQRFYAAHDDAYDFLVIFNGLDIPDSPGSLASARTVRNFATGLGEFVFDVGRQWGSASRLQTVINMGPMSQYPSLQQRFRNDLDTPITILAHEAGHRFLAFASTRDPVNPLARPMLGRQNAHWSFTFNSEASVLEGNRIRDFGPGTDPRFLTTGATEHYSPLDQYLMGLRAPEDVHLVEHDMFYVTGSGRSPLENPRLDVGMNGERRDVHLEEIVLAEGRRVPDHTVAQKRFRFAFILVVPKDTEPMGSQLEVLADLRREFETFFRTATSGRAFADTSLQRALKLSTFPAAGVLQGATLMASVALQRPAEADLTVRLTAPLGFAAVPASVTIPQGQFEAAFQIAGVRAGVEKLEAAAEGHETAYSNIMVSESAQAIALALGTPQFSSAGVVNAASFAPEIAPGALASIFGVNLALEPADAPMPWPTQLGGVRVLLNGRAVQLTAVRGLQVNFLVPADAAPGPAMLVVSTPVGQSEPVPVTIAPLAPGIFYNTANGHGAILLNGGYLEIYATGLGPVHPNLQTSLPVKAFIGGLEAEVSYSGLAPGYVGLYQVNARVPPGMSGTQPVRLEIEGRLSNEVLVNLP